jgi:glycosyltransferase involved in cell wall biosynthesis
MTRYSVIVPTYNAAPTLAALLESLDAQTLREFEIIVVDDASTDETGEVVDGAGARYERLDKNQGPAAARNRGAELAQGEWLVFADSDTEFQPDTLAKIDDILGTTDADALVGSYAGRPANPGFVPRYKALWEYVTIDMRAKLDERGLAAVRTWAPRPGVVRRAAFEAVGGFNTSFAGADLEDMEFGYRLAQAGHPIYLAPDIHIRHHYPATARQELSAFAWRVVLWMRMFRARREFEAAGEGSPYQALGDVSGFAAFLLLIAGLAYPPILILAGLSALTFALLHSGFVSHCLKEEGFTFAAKALVFRWVHTVVLGFAAGYGILTPGRNA